MQVNMLEAKTNLSRLIKLLQTKEEKEIILARGGVPVAVIRPLDKPDVSKRIGAALARGIPMPSSTALSFEALTQGDEDITADFLGGDE